jgi:hypothetical protein
MRDGGIGDRRCRQGEQVAQQRRRIGKIEHPGTAGGDRDQHPQRPFHDPLAEFFQVPALVPQLHPLVAVALDPAFDQDEQVGPDGLRAGIAAPHPTQRGCEQEQPQPGHDQKPRDDVEFVRPDLDPEEIEAPMRQIDQHRLMRQVRATVPANPRGQVIDAQRHPQDPPFQRAKAARHAAREHRFAGGVKAGRFWGRGHGGLRAVASDRMCQKGAGRALT